MTWGLLGIKVADYSQKREWRADSLYAGNLIPGRVVISSWSNGASQVLVKVMFEEIEAWLNDNCVGGWKRCAHYSLEDRLTDLRYDFAQYEDAALFYLRFK